MINSGRWDCSPSAALLTPKIDTIILFGHITSVIYGRKKNEDLYALATGKTIREINRYLPDAIAFGIIQKDG